MSIAYDPKPRPNRDLYIQVLRNMTPEQRLDKAFELSEFTKDLFRHGLRRRYPHLDEEEFQEVLRKHLARCHNRNY